MYQKTISLLEQIKESMSVSELHGIICGQVVTKPALNVQQWQATLQEFMSLSDIERQQMKQINLLYEHVHSELTKQAFDFEVLLPDDQASIASRAGALSKWCEGFLASFGIGFDAVASMSEESQEVLRDFVEISNMAWDNEDDSNVQESEDDLMQLIEYVRMATLFLFMDCNAVPEQPEMLH